MSALHPHRSAVRRLALARAISIAGGEAAYVALVTLTLTRTGSPGWVAAVLAAWIGVGGLVAPLAGALGDRFDRRRVMIASDLAGATCFVAIAFVHDPAALVALTALAAVSEAPFYSSSSAAIPNLAPADDLQWANSTVSAGRTVGRLVGPLLGGLLVATVPSAVAFGANAASFLASAILVATVTGTFSDPDRDEERHRGITAGFRFVANDHFLRWLTIAWVIFLTGVGLLLVAELPLARELGTGSVGYGVLIAAWAGGALGGAFLARRLLPRLGELRCLVLGTLGMALAIGLVAAAPVLVVAAVLLALGGVLSAISEVAEETLVQRATPDEVRSRVLAAMEATVVAALGLGLVAGGFVVEVAGPRVAYAATGVIGTAAALLLAWAVLHRRAEVPAAVS